MNHIGILLKWYVEAIELCNKFIPLRAVSRRDLGLRSSQDLRLVSHVVGLASIIM